MTFPLPIHLTTSLGKFEDDAVEASTTLLKAAASLTGEFKACRLKPFPYMSERVRRLVAVATLTYGRSKSSCQKLLKSRWQLDTDALLEAFGAETLLSESFVESLGDFCTSSTFPWPAVLDELRAARDTRRAAKGNTRLGVSVHREWVPQDVRDAMNAANVTRRKGTKRSETGNARCS